MHDPSSLALLSTVSEDWTFGLAYSPDGDYLAVSGRSQTIALYTCPQYVHAADASDYHNDIIFTIAFSPNSRLLVSGSRDEKAATWDVPSMAIVHSIQYEGGGVWTACFLNDETFVTRGEDSVIRIWDAGSGVQTTTIDVHASQVRFLALSPSGRTFATCSDDRTVKAFDSSTYECRQSVDCEGHVLRIYFVNDDAIVGGVEKSEPVLIDLSAGTVVRKFPIKMSWPWGVAVLQQKGWCG